MKWLRHVYISFFNRLKKESDEDYIFKSYIVENLREIVLLSKIPVIDPLKENNSCHALRTCNKYRIYINGSPEEIKKLIPLKSFKIIYHWSNLNECSIEIDIDEYKSVYKDRSNIFNFPFMNSLISKVSENIDNIHFRYDLINFEDPIFNIMNTFKESLELTGEINKELFKQAENIIKRFNIVIDQTIEKKEKYQKIEKEGIQKSLVERLNYENEYVDKVSLISIEDLDQLESKEILNIELKCSKMEDFFQSEQKGYNYDRLFKQFKDQLEESRIK